MRLVLYILTVTSVLSSCDDSIDYYQEKNTQPEFLIRTIGSTGDFLDKVTDTIKTSIASIYELEYQLIDEQDISTLDINSKNLNGGCDVLITENKIQITPQQQGLHNIQIIVSDIYQKQAVVNVLLYSFTNFKPIAQLSISEIKEGFLLDASASFDQDEKFGGTISVYEYTIHDKAPLELSGSNYQLTGVYYDFPVLVKVRVKDNDNVWSDYFYTTYTFAKL